MLGFVTRSQNSGGNNPEAAKNTRRGAPLIRPVANEWESV
jgi:hypothetical protein